MGKGNLSKRRGGFGAGYLYNFKGSVSTPSGLPNAPAFGDIYKILSTNKMVIWDGNAWTDLTDLRGEKGDKGDKGAPGEPFEDLGVFLEEELKYALDYLKPGLYKFTLSDPDRDGAKTVFVIANDSDLQGGCARQTFIDSEGSIAFRESYYKEDVWRKPVFYVTETELSEGLSAKADKASLNAKADKETSGGGFVAGEGSAVEDSAVAVGKGAKAKNGGFAGGLSTFSNAGGAVGQGAKAYGYGGAVGMNTVAGKGFSGGFGAVAARKAHDEDRVNCIQLGEGTNNVEKSLQVYNYQLLDGNGKIPKERIHELPSLWGGCVSSYSQLPENPAAGTYLYVSSDIANGVKYTGKVSELFYIMSVEYPDEILPLGPIWFTAPEACVEPYWNDNAEGSVCVYSESGVKIGTLVYNPTGLPDFIRGENLGLSSADDTVTFYLGIYDGTNFPSKIEAFPAGSMIFWNGTKWCAAASASSVGDIESALDSILSIQNTLTGGESE